MSSTDSPVFKKRSKGRPGSGVRDSALSAGADVETTSDASPDTLATKVKKAARVKPKARLSFGADDDEEGAGETFQVKKSALSRKIKAASPLVSLVPQDVTATRQDAPLYSKEYLSELKAQTLSTPPPRHATEDVDMFIDDSTFADASMQLADMDELPDPGETIIPSESSIVAAKQKRDRLRKTGGTKEDDFISLEVTKRSSLKDDGPHPESRLVREDDEVGEGDDELPEYTGAQERIALGKKARKVEERKRRAGMIEMIEDAYDVDDEESREWEMAQVRRAADADRDMSFASQAKARDVYVPAPIPTAIPIPTLGPAIAAFDRAVLTLTNSHAANSTTLAKLEDERTALQSQETELRKMVAEAESKRSWFSEFRDWIETVASFLDEKFPLLEKVEADYVSLIKERAEMLSKRRRGDDEDDIALFLGASVLPPPSGESAAETTPIVRGERRLARQTRRSTRRQRGVQPADEDGYSTDATLAEDAQADFDAAVADLESSRTSVLADVQAPEFRDPRKGLAVRFGEWRSKFADNYNAAFGGLGMVNSWEFWARLEVVGWNPAEDSRGLDTFPWYEALYSYSRPRQPGDEEEDEPELAQDGDLASAMVSTAIVGRMCKLIEAGALNPYSTAHVRRIVDVVESVEAALESDNLKFNMLLKAVLSTFREAVTSTSLLVQQCVNGNASARGPVFDPQAPPARRRSLARRLKLLRNLVRWRKYTGEKFGVGELATQLLRECMLPIAESGWEVGGEEIMRKVRANSL
ncbi:hypothetical protein EXIGLDRAFT_621222 [Exidia glandulosa HHB12029]|uniref:GCFC-domain-containing protein n=1 Tax=Exidia glandulosa HHB12029 TaxID=1314781 RepID=A0A165EHZ7_EXIGL|nr:hypothetical protein EXIGLDRAFT_621222 [Exidia glandulosa HHB12029]